MSSWNLQVSQDPEGHDALLLAPVKSLADMFWLQQLAAVCRAGKQTCQ